MQICMHAYFFFFLSEPRNRRPDSIRYSSIYFFHHQNYAKTRLLFTLKAVRTLQRKKMPSKPSPKPFSMDFMYAKKAGKKTLHINHSSNSSKRRSLVGTKLGALGVLTKLCIYNSGEHRIALPIENTKGRLLHLQYRWSSHCPKIVSKVVFISLFYSQELLYSAVLYSILCVFLTFLKKNSQPHPTY